MTENVTGGIMFGKLNSNQLQEGRSRLGLREWAEGS